MSSGISAAVIGRQLRQHTTTAPGRTSTSGPLLPAILPVKGRPRSPVHHLSASGRPYSPLPHSSGDPGGGPRLMYDYGPCVTRTAYDYTGLMAKPPTQTGNKSRKERMQEEPKLKCTWHCLCVAFKALSGGLVLLIAGTIMSVIGFMADAKHQNYIASLNTTGNTSSVEVPSLPTMYRNMTYAGPVIMGLGGIVICAALILTFEVRDTLGVKVQPEPPNIAPITLQSSSIQAISTVDGLLSKERLKHGKTSMIEETSNEKISTITSSSISPPTITKPMRSQLLSNAETSFADHLNSTQDPSFKIPGHKFDQPSSSHHHFSPSSKSSRPDPRSLTLAISSITDSFVHSQKDDPRPSSSSSKPLEEPFTDISSKVNLRPEPTSIDESDKVRNRPDISYIRNSMTQLLTPSSDRTSLTNLMSPSFESYLALPSPPDTQISDPDGCSVNLPSFLFKKNRAARCSCPASTASSIDLRLLGRTSGDSTSNGSFKGLDLESKNFTTHKSSVQNSHLSQRIQKHLIVRQQLILKQQIDQLQCLLQSLEQSRKCSSCQVSCSNPNLLKFPTPSKMLASMESDGLSTTSSSDIDLIIVKPSDDVLETEESENFSKTSSLEHSSSFRSDIEAPLVKNDRLGKFDFQDCNEKTDENKYKKGRRWNPITDFINRKSKDKITKKTDEAKALSFNHNSKANASSFSNSAHDRKAQANS
ncbi:uncharacterized protein LOC141853199 isoform X2 [Brevipalpus obovatus]|uniref:uncharacterized protein LOC141853199 isoform X2 n=1 Tax=Brevipalpus obovatus TaxID=246614 RepID=UPI003D9EDA83